MLKSYSSRKMFEIHPGFRKRYPWGGFWSGYEHHESTGLIDLEKSIIYCRNQQQRHGITVVDDRQQKLPGFAAEWDTARPWACRGTKAEQGYRGETPISFPFMVIDVGFVLPERFPLQELNVHPVFAIAVTCTTVP
jgi:hypothetical protein